MAEKPEKKSGGLFGNDDLDEEVASADDTGLVAQQQEIAEEEILSKIEDD
jgi:hypothetical protein